MFLENFILVTMFFFQDMIVAQNVSLLKFTGLLLMSFYCIWRSSLQKLIISMDGVSQTIMKNSFGKEQSFYYMYSTNCRRLSKLNRIMCTMTIMLPFVNCMTKPLVELMEGVIDNHMPLPINCPFERLPQGLYQLFTFLQVYFLD